MSAVPPRLVVPFNDHARVAFTEAARGACTARIPAAHELTNHLGTVHGGALFTVAEAASGRAFMEAALAQLGSMAADLTKFRAVVRHAQIRFRKPARGEISAYAQVLTPSEQWTSELMAHGKAIANVAVEVKDAAGTIVADLQVEWHLSHARADATSA